MNNPCKECPRRAVGCHGSCEDYGAYRKQLDAIIEARTAEMEAIGYRKEVLFRYMRRVRNRIRKDGRLE